MKETADLWNFILQKLFYARINMPFSSVHRYRSIDIRYRYLWSPHRCWQHNSNLRSKIYVVNIGNNVGNVQMKRALIVISWRETIKILARIFREKNMSNWTMTNDFDLNFRHPTETFIDRSSQCLAVCHTCSSSGRRARYIIAQAVNILLVVPRTIHPFPRYANLF